MNAGRLGPVLRQFGRALGAEGLNGAVLEAQPLVRYAAIGNALMFDWRGVLSLAVYEELLIYGVWIRGLAGSAIWKTAVVVCTTPCARSGCARRRST